MESIYTIKPLEWAALSNDETPQRAEMPHGFYEVWCHGRAGYYVWRYYFGGVAMSGGYDFDTAEDAKAAAEAHYLNMVKRFLKEATERVVVLATGDE
jgi:hypothetical protein